MQALERSAYAHHSLHYHLVLVTKYRKQCLTPEVLDRLQELAGEITVRWRGRVLQMNGERDHVHLLL